MYQDGEKICLAITARFVPILSPPSPPGLGGEQTLSKYLRITCGIHGRGGGSGRLTDTSEVKRKNVCFVSYQESPTCPSLCYIVMNGHSRATARTEMHKLHSPADMHSDLPQYRCEHSMDLRGKFPEVLSHAHGPDAQSDT